MTVREQLASDPYTGLKVYAELDNDPISPFDMDSAVVFAVLHRRYVNPAENEGLTSVEAIAEFEEANKEETGEYAVFPLFMLDHSGTVYRASQSGANPFACPWDSGRVGVIALKRADMPEGADLFKMAQDLCEAYTAYANGDVWGFVVEDAQGDEVESSWGFYSLDDAKASALEAYNAVLPVHTKAMQDDQIARITRQTKLASKLTECGFDDEDEGPAILVRLAKGEGTGDDFQRAAEYLADYGDDDLDAYNAMLAELSKHRQ